MAARGKCAANQALLHSTSVSAITWDRAMPLPVADEGIAGFLQRSENRRNSVSPNDSPGTARRKQRKPERFSGHRKAEGYMVPRLQIPAPRILAGGSPPSLLSARRILIRGCICPLARTLPTDQDLEVLLMPCPAHSSACIRFFLSRTLLTL